MTTVCLYFKVHQPFQLKHFSATDVDVCHSYKDEQGDMASVNRIADACYLPANALMLSLINKYKGQFKISYSISGTTLELLQRYRPDVIESFAGVIQTGCAEILSETYYHSLSWLHSRKEFKRQVIKHFNLVKSLFGVEPVVFRNTELIYNNELAGTIEGLGFKGILCEGVERVLSGRNVNQVYAAPAGNPGETLSLFLRNAALSDDIAFRFNDSNWSEHPLTADKFADWIHSHPEHTEVINLFMDYETFGIHKTADTGIFDFLEALPGKVMAGNGFRFSTPSELLQQPGAKPFYDVPDTISWEDKTLATCVWCENMMQNNTLKKIYSMERMVMENGGEETIATWGHLQSADYFYYMAEERSKGEAYKYENPFHSPQQAFQHYTNMIIDFEITLIRQGIEKRKQHLPLKEAVSELL